MEGILKICGALMILLSGTMLGWLISLRYKNRVLELRGLQLAVKIIDTEIRYKQTKLAEAFNIASQVVRDPLAIILEKAASQLIHKRDQEFRKIWTEVWHNNKNLTNLEENDIKIILDWGSQIGSSPLGKLDQISHSILVRLEEKIKRAQESADKKVKLSRYTGVLISLLIIIIFY